MTGLALALSPHLDDAAFSAGGTLARLAAAGWRVVVATVFTRSVPNPTGFALACQLDKGLPADLDYMALRRNEDTLACRALGAEARRLDLPEAPHRGYGSAPELFGPLRSDDAAVGEVTSAIGALLAELRPDLILAPQAIGGHVDHVAVVGAFQAVAPAEPVLWWRDFPYVDRKAAPREPFAEDMSGFAAHAVTLDPGSTRRKRESCLAYVSQLGFQFGGPEGLDRRLAATGGMERFRVKGDLPSVLATVTADAAA